MAPVSMVSADAVTAGLAVVVPADAVTAGLVVVVPADAVMAGLVAVVPADADREPDINFRFPMSLIHPPESPPPS
jgi:hypothetical protein